MVMVPPSVDLVLESAALPASGPRLWRLIFGLACLVLAVALLALHVMGPGLAGTVSEIGFVSALLCIAGVPAIVQAVRSDLFRVNAVCLSARGLQIDWSHAPSLTGRSVTGHRFVDWDEVVSIRWLEGLQDHDFRQLLELTLREPLAPHRHRLQLLVSEGRHVERCAALAALLPSTAVRPGWMAPARRQPLSPTSAPSHGET